MKAVILAGGLGTRISEESHLRPKPMIEIGGRPILWHIMKIYGAQGITDFVICCGYKGYMIKEYFANYFLHMSDVTFDLSENSMQVHQRYAEPWKVTLVDTGEHTQTGGRLRRVRDHLDDTFCLTYGDGVADIDLAGLIAHHRAEGVEATITAVQPSGRYGALDIQGTRVHRFLEKPQGDGRWVSGGFLVLEPSIIDRIAGDEVPLEATPLESLAVEGQLTHWKHSGFWAAMDTMRDKQALEQLWKDGAAPWKIWK
ncbi:glucose-1-phosphate cytidylyltransferase [Defluviimonas sp. 20V17]|uniref:Glucose-1-phosphate cytidylyltransferase n=1 Tax=Allgaiera indica TaxID=765699 RepID=A0A1H2W3F3_9RHOB|nr:glucose-1-phosphate cytidylyltransferase [Allgaiera indica]KDB03132.1 glucose-1-phosphate cytidylyltransferase [Defluviimonas sp. 20V17]SDW75057.1 glucose-1-phosphate cytidylyltransferase [Allgaiera indica]